MRGLGAAVGCTTDIACIVPNLADIGCVKKADIRITNSTGPGWAPVFSIISGLLLESRGLLAHGACLSREYGLSSVLLRHTMNLLEDGTEITVDGATGEVSVFAASHAEPA